MSPLTCINDFNLLPNTPRVANSFSAFSAVGILFFKYRQLVPSHPSQYNHPSPEVVTLRAIASTQNNPSFLGNGTIFFLSSNKCSLHSRFVKMSSSFIFATLSYSLTLQNPNSLNGPFSRDGGRWVWNNTHPLISSRMLLSNGSHVTIPSETYGNSLNNKYYSNSINIFMSNQGRDYHGLFSFSYNVKSVHRILGGISTFSDDNFNPSWSTYFSRSGTSLVDSVVSRVLKVHEYIFRARITRRRLVSMFNRNWNNTSNNLNLKSQTYRWAFSYSGFRSYKNSSYLALTSGMFYDGSVAYLAAAGYRPYTQNNMYNRNNSSSSFFYSAGLVSKNTTMRRSNNNLLCNTGLWQGLAENFFLEGVAQQVSWFRFLVNALLRISPNTTTNSLYASVSTALGLYAYTPFNASYSSASESNICISRSTGTPRHNLTGAWLSKYTVRGSLWGGLSGMFKLLSVFAYDPAGVVSSNDLIINSSLLSGSTAMLKSAVLNHRGSLREFGPVALPNRLASTLDSFIARGVALVLADRWSRYVRNSQNVTPPSRNLLSVSVSATTTSDKFFAGERLLDSQTLIINSISNNDPSLGVLVGYKNFVGDLVHSFLLLDPSLVGNTSIRYVRRIYNNNTSSTTTHPITIINNPLSLESIRGVEPSAAVFRSIMNNYSSNSRNRSEVTYGMLNSFSLWNTCLRLRSKN